MIGPHFDSATEEDLLRQYLDTAPRPAGAGSLAETCAGFRSTHTGESILDHTHDTTWVREWIDGPAANLGPSSRERRICALGCWWTWLFNEGALDDNVLACFRGAADVLGQADAPLVLAHNLQRPIARYLEERGPGPGLSSKHIRFALRHFNVFLNRRSIEPTVDEGFIVDWLRDLGKTRSTLSVALAAGHATTFLDFLVETGRLRDNPLATLRARHERQPCFRIVGAVLGVSGPLEPTPARPGFQSPLAEHLEQFLALKHAMGRKYRKVKEELLRFDRFVAGRSTPCATLSRELVEEWLLAGRNLHPRTRKKRVSLVRQFALYLIRIDPATYVPDRTFWPARVPKFKAHIYSEEEYRALLKAALELPSLRSPLRPRALFTLLLVLYSTGIRVGEATRLKLGDLDLEAQTLLITETKFFKSRVVPFSDELADQLETYLETRRRFAASSPESPLFVNNRRRAFAVQTIANLFKRLLAAAGIPRTPATGPRVHDIRHSFACTRVLRWYREGADVTAKLPLLATYMGHVSVLSTEIYLRSTPEILGEASSRFEAACGALVGLSEVNHERQ